MVGNLKLTGIYTYSGGIKIADLKKRINLQDNIMVRLTDMILNGSRKGINPSLQRHGWN